ncbi:MAG: hypothetical protein GXO81_06335 [Chlorobi bacterium]|nr:hypothetical protein [Chlorobiota bacterium]
MSHSGKRGPHETGAKKHTGFQLLKQADLIPEIRGKSRVSEILNRAFSEGFT